MKKTKRNLPTPLAATQLSPAPVEITIRLRGQALRAMPVLVLFVALVAGVLMRLGAR